MYLQATNTWKLLLFKQLAFSGSQWKCPLKWDSRALKIKAEDSGNTGSHGRENAQNEYKGDSKLSGPCQINDKRETRKHPAVLLQNVETHRVVSVNNVW